MGGVIVALTGLAPEEWLGRAVHEMHISEGALHLWTAGVDVRIIPITLGVAVIVIALTRQHRASLVSAGAHAVAFAGSGNAAPAAAPRAESAEPAAPARDHLKALPLPAKPSIAVLPFINRSNDPDQEYFSDGIAEDISTELSRNHSLFVIASNSSFTYKGRAVDAKQVAGELGVRYLLEGSVRREGNRVRITAQLIEAEVGNHVWVERYDRDLTDVFAVQDEITSAVVAEIAPAISQAERQRAILKSTANLSAWEAYQRGLWHVSRGGNSDLDQGLEFFQRAATLDPSFAEPHAMLARFHLARMSQGGNWSPQDAVTIAESEARAALRLDADSGIAHAALAWVFNYRGDSAAALEEAERAVALNANDPAAYLVKGRILVFARRASEGRLALNTSLRLDPRGAMAPTALNHLAISCYLERDYASAEAAAKQVIHAYPDFPRSYLYLAASLGQLGRQEEAGQALREAKVFASAYFNFVVRNRPPWYQAEDFENLLDGLRKAGLQG